MGLGRRCSLLLLALCVGCGDLLWASNDDDENKPGSPTGPAGNADAGAAAIVADAGGMVTSDAANIEDDPTLVDFGGMYGQGAYKNPATGALSCPEGYTKTRVFGTDNKDNDIFACSRPHERGRPPLVDFGGMYGGGANGAGTPVKFVNPITKDMTCPDDTYEAVKVLGTINLDHPLWYCHRPHSETTGILRFDGMFGNSLQGYLRNPVTGKSSCPEGSTPEKVLGTSEVDWGFVVCYRP